MNSKSCIRLCINIISLTIIVFIASCSNPSTKSILTAKSLTDHPFAAGVTKVILKVNLILSPYADLPKSTTTKKTVYLHFDIIWD